MEFKNYPVKPFVIRGEGNIETILRDMEDLSFQARNLGLSFKIWKEMLRDKTFIFLGLAGAMVPAGMRKIISYLVIIDWLIVLSVPGQTSFIIFMKVLAKSTTRQALTWMM